MDVFDIVGTAAGDALCAAAIAAAHELGVFAALADAPAGSPRSADDIADALGLGAGRARLRKLLDVLAAIGAIARAGDRFAAFEPAPARPEVLRDGWGRLAEVIRADRPLALGAEADRYHHHLYVAGAAAAAELAPMLGAGPLLDLGGGAGVYTAALLDARPDARATIVDAPSVIALARGRLARFGDRVTFVAGDARELEVGGGFGAVLLANVLHLHGPATCAALCAAAARAVAPGGVVVVKDLRMDTGRRGPLGSVLFALNMATYTDAGDVYEASTIRAWLAEVGLVDLAEHRLACTPDAIAITARKPSATGIAESEADATVSAIAVELDTRLARAADDTWRELAAAGTRRLDATAPTLLLPRPLRHHLAHAIACERADDRHAAADALARHYADVLPRQRVAQLASTAEPGATLFHAPLPWSRLPRLSAALDRLFATLIAAGAEPTAALGAPTAEAFRARTPTLATLYARTHYGGAFPLLYGSPADLASFEARGRAANRDVVDVAATIDRYLTAPIIHELCHFAPTRDAIAPLHLDECVGGWLGVHVHREFAYPAADCDDAIYAAPWLAQVGQAFARAFGIAAVVRAHAGTEPWTTALPPALIAAAARLGRDDWRTRRSLHLLADTLAPAPWVALAFAARAGDRLAEVTLESLAAMPLPALAAALPVDDAGDAFDRAIVDDALAAMCVVNARVGGSFAVRSAPPAEPIAIDAHAARVTTARRGDVDPIAPAYWLPPTVAARLLASGIAGYTLRITTLAALPLAAAAICAASPGVERDGFALAARRTARAI